MIMVKENTTSLLGYKAFNKDLTNLWKKKFLIGEKYCVSPEHKECGYHFCPFLEDVFVFYNDSSNTVVCEVKGTGNIIKYYNDVYDILVYASSEIELLKEISREEILDYYLSKNDYYVRRIVNFLIRGKLSMEEVELFKRRFSDNNQIMDTIKYYYYGDKDVYQRRLSKYR